MVNSAIPSFSLTVTSLIDMLTSSLSIICKVAVSSIVPVVGSVTKLRFSSSVDSGAVSSLISTGTSAKV